MTARRNLCAAIAFKNCPSCGPSSGQKIIHPQAGMLIEDQPTAFFFRCTER